MSQCIALATTAEARNLDEDHAPLSAALHAQGFAVEAPDWDDESIDWRRYAMVLPRSTWNYTDDLPKFLAWARRVSGTTRLCNDARTIEWNTDKRYLLELERAGVPIVPTYAAPPGTVWEPPAGVAEYVVKPAVGAGSRGARRFLARETDAAAAHAARLQASGVTAITQPYLAAVERAGETALIYFEGAYSHAIRKGPLLARGGGDVQGLFATEQITPREPGADERAVGDRIVAALVARGGTPLYARVDLLRDDDGAPRLLELELTEPSLFFAHAAGSADRLAVAIRRRLAGSG